MYAKSSDDVTLPWPGFQVLQYTYSAVVARAEAVQAECAGRTVLPALRSVSLVRMQLLKKEDCT